MAERNTNIEIKVIEGIGKESKKPWKGISVNIGDWSQLVFAKTKFEMDYIEQILEENSK